jgi:hypothetical protein
MLKIGARLAGMKVFIAYYKKLFICCFKSSVVD